MRYVSIARAGRNHVGVLDDAGVHVLEGVTEIDASTDIAALRDAPAASEAIPLADVELRPASPAPRRIVCVGLNYRSHIDETGRGDSDYPVLFAKFASNLIAAGSDIQLPPEGAQPDYEGELAVVIGRRGRRISPQNALDHVLGYSVANDITIRDFQYLTHQWLPGKAWDASTPLGPAIVTPDEVDLQAAGIRTLINGELVQESSLDLLIFSIPRLIAEISTFTELEPGDVILTGTPAGVGYRRSPQRFLGPGDTVVVEIDGVGRLENGVVAETVDRSQGERE